MKQRIFHQPFTNPVTGERGERALFEVDGHPVQVVRVDGDADALVKVDDTLKRVDAGVVQRLFDFLNRRHA